MASLGAGWRQRRRASWGFSLSSGEAGSDHGTQRPAHRSDCDGALVERLARAWLIAIDGDTVEIAHEALIRTWPRLREWISADQEGLRLHRRLGMAAAEWEAMERDEGVLYQGVRLAAANGLVPTRTTSPARSVPSWTPPPPRTAPGRPPPNAGRAPSRAWWRRCPCCCSSRCARVRWRSPNEPRPTAGGGSPGPASWPPRPWPGCPRTSPARPTGRCAPTGRRPRWTPAARC